MKILITICIGQGQLCLAAVTKSSQILAPSNNEGFRFAQVSCSLAMGMVCPMLSSLSDPADVSVLIGASTWKLYVSFAHTFIGQRK